ncbi:ROK family protein [Paenarthrobacter sp. NPDC089675]|uniref:ROK family protein n=1 Tax=Paenarthrobacter sp. NPDC089675 TaxID=3364376 RepID=UPI00380C1A2D
MVAKDEGRHGMPTDETVGLLGIINLVRTGRAMTRSDLGRVTGLGRGVVTQRLERAFALGFLGEGVLAPSSGGRAPKKLQFLANQGMIVSCVVTAEQIEVGVAMLDGNVLGHCNKAWDMSRGPMETFEATRHVIDKLLAKEAFLPVWGVVIGLPCQVNFSEGRVVAAPGMSSGWGGIKVRDYFEERYRAPVWVDSEINLLAIGERTGLATTNPDLIYCKVDAGVSSALLTQGRVHRGANGAAGELGHVKVAGSADVCRCGDLGCLEAIAGGWALLRSAGSAMGEGASTSLLRILMRRALSLEDLTQAARDGDALSVSLVQASARTTGEALSRLVSMFNPDAVILTGAVASTGELFLSEVRQRIYELASPLATRDLTIGLSAFEPQAGVRGGIELALEQLFEVTFADWFANSRPSPQTQDSAPCDSKAR